MSKLHRTSRASAVLRKASQGRAHDGAAPAPQVPVIWMTASACSKGPILKASVIMMVTSNVSPSKCAKRYAYCLTWPVTEA
jgi:hypothetical protein